MAQLKF